MVQESLCDAQYMNCCFYLDSAELNYIQEQELHNHSQNNYLLLLQVSLTHKISNFQVWKIL